MQDWNAVYECCRQNDVAAATELLQSFIASQDAQQFSCSLDASFSNAPAAILNELNAFISSCKDRFDVQSIYLEMNGFDLNYDRWYCDFFAYSSYSSQAETLEDIFWLGDCLPPCWSEIELTGMDSVQRAFAWYHEQRIWKSQPGLEPVYEATRLLVMTKFAGLVRSALDSGELVSPVPVLVSAHDFEPCVRYDF